MKVTVITPVLNGVKTINKCINSVKMQDYPDIEHLIIDGCSTDGTLDILNNSNVRYISEPDTGIYDAFNKGIFYSKGELIHILNADDYYANSNIVSIIVDLVRKGGYDLVHGFVKQVDNNGNILWTIGKNIEKKQLLRKMSVAHPSVFIKKSIFKKYGGFNVSCKIAGDYDFLLRIWDDINKYFLPETLVLMRMEGVSNCQVILSSRESLSISILHGKKPINAYCRYLWEILKHKFVIIPFREMGYKK